MDRPRRTLACIVLQYFLVSRLVVCEGQVVDGNSTTTEDQYHNMFIAQRMTQLKAVSELKQVKDDVKLHKLVLDLTRQTFNVLDDVRKVLTNTEHMVTLENLLNNPVLFRNVFKSLENTAFFCDLVVFFPQITLRQLEANLLWRVALIDSIQYATTINLKFVDKSTRLQFEKALKILSEGIEIQEHEHNSERKPKETQKTLRRPRLSTNEL